MQNDETGIKCVIICAIRQYNKWKKRWRKRSDKEPIQFIVKQKKSQKSTKNRVAHFSQDGIMMMSINRSIIGIEVYRHFFCKFYDLKIRLFVYKLYKSYVVKRRIHKDMTLSFGGRDYYMRFSGLLCSLFLGLCLL